MSVHLGFVIGQFACRNFQSELVIIHIFITYSMASLHCIYCMY